MPNARCDLIATHLNTPYGPVLSAADVERALKDQNLLAFAQHGKASLAAALLAGIFLEFSPSLIGGACHELGIPLAHANNLYGWLVSNKHSPRAPRWESEIEGLA
jgi:hypothetical protein